MLTILTNWLPAEFLIHQLMIYFCGVILIIIIIIMFIIVPLYKMKIRSCDEVARSVVCDYNRLTVLLLLLLLLRRVLSHSMCIFFLMITCLNIL